MTNTLSYRECMELVSILLYHTRELNKEVARLGSRRIELANYSCSGHAKELVEKGPSRSRYCTVCGKPHAGKPGEMYTYSELIGLVTWWKAKADRLNHLLRQIADDMEYYVQDASLDGFESLTERIEKELDHEDHKET